MKEDNKKLYGRHGTVESSMLKDVFERSWFSRMWTVQELVLGFKATILCGTAELGWDKFFFAISLLAGLEQKAGISKTIHLPSLEIYAKMRALLHQELSISALAKDKSVYQVLIRTRHLNSGDPRDKLYGLFGYLTRLGANNLPPVDYNHPVNQVYVDFTRFAVQHDQSLNMLFELDGIASPHAMPSWTPDWSRKLECSRIVPTKFAAAMDSPTIFRFSTNDEMHLQGVIVDTVKKRAESGVVLDGPDLKMEEILATMTTRIQMWQQWLFLAMEVAPQPLQENLAGLLLNTILTADVSDADREAISIWINLLITYHPANTQKEEAAALVDEIVEWALQRPAVWALYFSGDVDPIPVINTPEWRVMIALADPGTPKQNQLHLKIVRKTVGMTMFTTEGGLLGTCSDALKVGDEIALISGMNLPMIVRRMGNGTFRFVAPAYVHGIMNGEKWPVGDRGEVVTDMVFV